MSDGADPQQTPRVDTDRPGPEPAQPQAAASATNSNALARLPWIIAWAASVVVAFILGTQSTNIVGQPAAPDAPAPTASASRQQTEAQTAPPQGAQTVEPQIAEILQKLPRRDPADITAKGSTDAKVVLVEWSDYRCPFCATWHTQTLPALQKYIDDGTLRIEYRDYPIFGDQSTDTALAARAAGLQGRFWEYQDAVFAAAPSSGHPDLPRPKLIEFARAAGVPDIDRFQADMADQDLKKAVENDAQQARELGIGGTPFFVINDGFINGARPTGDFIHAVESAAQR